VAPVSLLFPYTTLFRSRCVKAHGLFVLRLLALLRCFFRLGDRSALALRIPQRSDFHRALVFGNLRLGRRDLLRKPFDRCDEVARSEEHTSELQSRENLV